MKTKLYSVISTLVALLCWSGASLPALAQHEGHGGQKPAAQERQKEQPASKDGQQKKDTQQQGMPMNQPGQGGQQVQHQGMNMETPMTMKPNQVLAMAYMQNMSTFAKALRDEAQRGQTINGDFARDAVAEMRRGFDQMERYHQEQMDAMQMGANSQMSGMSGHQMTGNMNSQMSGQKSGQTGGQMAGHQMGNMNSQMGGQIAGHQMSGQMNGQMSGMMQMMRTHHAQISSHLIELERESGIANPDSKWMLEHTNEILKHLDEMAKMQGGNAAAR